MTATIVTQQDPLFNGFLALSEGMVYPLTPCCKATAKGLEDCIGCRGCYREVDPMYGAFMAFVAEDGTLDAKGEAEIRDALSYFGITTPYEDVARTIKNVHLSHLGAVSWAPEVPVAKPEVPDHECGDNMEAFGHTYPSGRDVTVIRCKVCGAEGPEIEDWVL